MTRIRMVVGIAGVLCFWLLSVLVLQQLSRQQSGGGVVIESGAQCDPQKSTLLVAVHGLGGRIERLEPLLILLEKEFPQANMLAVRYPVGWLANSSPTGISRELERVISNHYTECQRTPTNGYKTIILLGYSTGALLVRQAFLLGMGENQGDDLTPVPIVRTRQEWTTKVARIVLLAGMNRGWSLDRRPDGMRRVDWLLAHAVRPLLSVANVSGFLFDIERGAPFVANLRLAWVRAVAKYPNNFPTVVQILGRSDEVVTREDETDMAASVGFVFISAGDVNHNSILDVQKEGPAKAAILDALKLPTQALFTRYGVNSLASVEVTVHGVNDRRSASHLRDCGSREGGGVPAASAWQHWVR